MSVYTEQEVRELFLIASRMSLKLQEFVYDAIESSGNPNALRDIQALIRDWHEMNARTGFSSMDDDRYTISLSDL